MRFIGIYKPAQNPATTPPSRECMEQMQKVTNEMAAAGVLLATEGFAPHPDDVRVRLSEGQFTVTDGPFTESKELIGGFALMQANSKEEIIEHTKRFLRAAGGGECEIHQLLDAPERPLDKPAR